MGFYTPRIHHGSLGGDDRNPGSDFTSPVTEEITSGEVNKFSAFIWEWVKIEDLGFWDHRF